LSTLYERPNISTSNAFETALETVY